MINLLAAIGYIFFAGFSFYFSFSFFNSCPKKYTAEQYRA